MEGPKGVKIKLRDISLVPQIQRSRRKRRLMGASNNKPTRITRQLTATSAVILLKLILLAISLTNHNRNLLPLASCHNFKSPSSLEPNAAQELMFHSHQQPDDDVAPRLERLIGLMLNLSHEPQLAYERRIMNSNAESTESLKKSPATASEQLRKLLARPRQVLFSFVPQILSKQMVLKRPPVTNHSRRIKKNSGGGVVQVSRQLPVEISKHLNQTTSNLLTHRHLHQANGSPGPGELPVFDLLRPPHEFPQIVRAPPPPPFISMPPLRYPVGSAQPPDMRLHNQQQQQQQVAATLTPNEEAGDEEPSESVSGGGDESNLASEAERGLSQIDQLIKREFETRLDLNERADEWQRQHPNQRDMFAVGGDGGGGGGGERATNDQPDTTLASPLNQAAAGEPTTVQPAGESNAAADESAASGARDAAAPPAVFLSWPPRIHHEPRQPAEESEGEGEGEEWRSTDFPRSLLTAAPLSPSGNTRKSRDSGGTLSSSAADIVLGRPDAMRLPPPPGRISLMRPPPHPTTGAANDALSAFVPSALETIAQLKLNQTINNQQVMPPNVPIAATTTTNVHKSHQQPSAANRQHISLLNGRPAFGEQHHNHKLPIGGHQTVDRAHSQLAHILAPSHQQSTNYLRLHLRNSHELVKPTGELVNWRHDQTSSDLRETLRRLRETKAKIRQLQAELEHAGPPSGLFVAETNKTITQYVDQLSTSQTSEQAKRSSGQDAAGGRGGLEWFRSWSPPYNRTSLGGLRPIVRAQQSMNMPLGLYYGAGPLTTPARLVASAVGRTVQHSMGASPGILAALPDQPPTVSPRPAKIWSSTLTIPSGDNQAPHPAKSDLMLVRPSSAPILLGSTLKVAPGTSEQQHSTTVTSPSLTNATNPPMSAGNVPAGTIEYPAGLPLQNNPQRLPKGDNSSTPADVLSSGLRNDDKKLTSGGASDQEDDHDDEPGDERPPSASKDSDNNNNNNNSRRLAAEGHQQRARDSKLGVVSVPSATVKPAPQIPTTLSAAGVDHHQRQDEPASRQQQEHYQAVHKNGDDKRAPLSSFNLKPAMPRPAVDAATESPIVIVGSPLASIQQAGGVLHVLAPPPQLVGLTTRKPSRANPGQARVPIMPAVASGGGGESDRSPGLNSNGSITQAFDDFTSEPPARSFSPIDNFFARLMGDFANLFKVSNGNNSSKSEQSPIKIGTLMDSSPAPFQVARSLNSRAHLDHSGARAGPGNQKQDQQVVAKLTTERLARNLIVIVSALSLVSLVAVMLFVRLQQARRTRRQNFSDPKQLSAGSQSSSSGGGGGGNNPSSLEEDSLYFDAHQQQLQPHERHQQHRCSGWRRLGPINFISNASKGYQQAQANQDKIILDGTMRNVSLLAKHRPRPEHQHRTQPKTIDLPRPLMNRSCCHCVSCSESWLFRDAQQLHQHKRGHDTPLCSSGFYHPAPRGKLPFGAASSVNNMLQRSASSRSQQVIGKQNQHQQQVGSQEADTGGDKQQQQHQQPTMGNQRAPIGGTRLRMMSAIDESAADRSSSTASDASEWQAHMLLNGDCSDEFDANNRPLTSACDCEHNHSHQHQQRRHYQQHQRHNLGCCPGCSGHLLTAAEEQPDSAPLESDGASFIVPNGHQHRFGARDEMTSQAGCGSAAAAAAPKDSNVRGQEIKSARTNKNDACCCGTRAAGRTDNKSSECHDKRLTGNFDHRETSTIDENRNCSRCCDKVSISNRQHSSAEMTTPSTNAAK